MESVLSALRKKDEGNRAEMSEGHEEVDRGKEVMTTIIYNTSDQHSSNMAERDH